MSGVFNPNEPGIVATDDEAVAKAHGLTEWDEGRGQYVKPPQPSDAGQRDGWAKPDHENYDAERVEQQQREADAQQQREARDEDPAEHDALAAGNPPGTEPAAKESDNAEPLLAEDNSEAAPTSGRKRK